MEREQALAQIKKELATADQAKKAGNEGMVRVCARRAAAVAITFWLQFNPRKGWGVDAMNQLRSLALDDSLPLPVREAAQRLKTKVTAQFTSPFTGDPIQDSRTIIEYLLESVARE
jgi:hypothetical protein